ncbi:hypothetical protein CNYM01_06661 [Colletotrichum nymphaeae SA-01]|uniref:Uncharacterized protein n=1 Tax=Colletotrichum nymphaeae SA-01 TaxID=1460502 RepID=A0A135UWA2_9PEZI|nr:hypothetical protein CNYM01_06661 [Colletotrichum nymphaeae SA-01]
MQVSLEATWITDHPGTVDWCARLELDSEVTRLSEALKNASSEKGSRNTPFTSQLVYEQLLPVCRSLSLVVPSFLLRRVDLQRPGGLLSSNGSLHMHPYGNTDLREHLGMRDLQRGYRVHIAFYTLRISMSNRRCPLEQIYNLPKPRNAIIKLSHRTNTLHRTRASASITWTVLGHVRSLLLFLPIQMETAKI